jgi:hypothetical protein
MLTGAVDRRIVMAIRGPSPDGRHHLAYHDGPGEQ